MAILPLGDVPSETSPPNCCTRRSVSGRGFFPVVEIEKKKKKKKKV
jgi:hypothetical protein